MKKLINYFKNLFCRHLKMEVVRWHWVHIDGYPFTKVVEAEYRCSQCGRLVTNYYVGSCATRFIEEYKDKEW